MAGNEPAQTPALMDQIYSMVSSFMGINGTQTFVLEAPGRVLDEDTYVFPTDSIYSTIEKPQPVLEAEFRLSDDLYDFANMCGGPNGLKLSLQYVEALNNLVPALGQLDDFEKDRATLRAWLLEAVTTTVDSKPFNGTRMELFQELSNTYLTAKAQWEDTKTARLTAARNARNESAMDDYTRWLANEAPVMEAQLEAMFADLVVRGFYHEVRTYLGFLDVASPAEALEDAKARMRDSSMSSLDETETVYPVVMEPVDWFKGLSTDFQPVDLTLDPGFLQTQLLNLEQQLDQLTAERQQLMAAPTGNPAQLRKQVSDAQSAYDTAQSAQLEQFSNATVTALQIAVKAYSATLVPAGEAAAVLGDVVAASGSNPSSDATAAATGVESQLQGLGFPLSSADLTQLAGLQKATIEAQQQLMSASRALADLQAQQAAANATDTKQAVAALDSQIQTMQTQIDALKRAVLANGTVDTSKMVPSNMPPAGRWYDIIAQVTGTTTQSSSTLSQEGSHSGWDVDFLFGSASGSNDQSASSWAHDFQSAMKDVQVGFRVTKVTMDRGGWFDPGLLNASGSMQRLSTASISNGSPADPTKITSAETNAAQQCLLPSYPVAFVIAKDVTIKVTLNGTVSSDASNYLSQSSSAGGGFLCFSASSSSSATQSGQAFFSSAASDTVIIRIPGPQILGWIVEYVGKDGSQPYTALPTGFPPPDPSEAAQHAGQQGASMSALTANAAPAAVTAVATPSAPLSPPAVTTNGTSLIGGRG